jgi:phage N-6-adenine-methyltransferase
MPEQKPGRSKQDYSTPRELIDAVCARFGSLQFDLAATRRNSIVPDRFFSPRDNSLAQDWRKLKQERLWLNPPFGDIEPWAKKCAETVGKKIFFLVPASVGSNWYKNYVHDVSSVYFLSPRLSFDGKNSYPKDVLLACYGGRVGHHECWRWDRP